MILNRSDFQKLTETRLREAQVLLAAGEYSGAYYLAGYSIECALKARVASFTRQYDFPDKRKTLEYYTHSLKDLVKAANLVEELREQQSSDEAFATAWAAAINWTNRVDMKRFLKGRRSNLEPLSTMRNTGC